MASFVQGTGIQSVGTVASVSKAFASNVASGNLLLINGVSAAADIPAVGGVTDTLSHTYARDIIRQRQTSERVGLFSTVATSSAACTVTVDATGNDNQSIGISEHAPTGGNTWSTTAATRLDGTPGGGDAAAAATTTATAANVVTGGTGVIVGAVAHGSGTVAITPNASYTQIFEDEDSTDMPFNFVYRLITAGTYGITWTFASAVLWDCVAAAYKETAGGGPAGQPTMRRFGAVDRSAQVQFGHEGQQLMRRFDRMLRRAA